MPNSLQEVIQQYIDKYQLATGQPLAVPQQVPVQSFQNPRRAPIPNGSAPAVSDKPPQRPNLSQKKSSLSEMLNKQVSRVERGDIDKTGGWQAPLLIGAGGATALWKKDEIKAILSRLGIGKDVSKQMSGRYANPRFSQIAQRILSAQS